MDAIARCVWLEGGGHEGPDVGARVGDVLDDGEDWDDVGGGAAEEDEGYEISSVRSPGDGEALPGWDELAELRVADWIPAGW